MQILEWVEFWIKKLNTAFPFGLNDNIKGYGTISEGCDPLLYKDNPYLNSSCINLKRKNKKRRRKSKRVDDDVCNALKDFTKDKIPLLVKYLRNRSQRTLALVYQYTKMNNDLPLEVLLAIKAYLARYYHVPKETLNQVKNEIIKIHFTHPVQR